MFFLSRMNKMPKKRKDDQKPTLSPEITPVAKVQDGAHVHVVIVCVVALIAIGLVVASVMIAKTRKKLNLEIEQNDKPDELKKEQSAIEQKITELSETVSTLESTKTSATETLKDAKASLQTLIDRAASLRAKIEEEEIEHRNKMEGFKTNIAQCQAEIASIDQQIASAEKNGNQVARAELLSKLDLAQLKLTDLQTSQKLELLNHEELVSKHEQEIETIEVQIEDIKREKAVLTGAVDELATQKARCELEFNVASSQLSSVEQEIRKLNSTEEDFQTKIGKLENLMKSSQARVDENRAEIEKLRDINGSLDREIEKVDGRIRVLTHKNESHTKQIAMIEASLQTASKNIKDVQTQISAVARELIDIEDQINENETQLAQLKRTKRQTEDGISKLQTEIEHLKKPTRENTNVSKAIDQKQKELATQIEMLNALNFDIAQADETHKSLKNALKRKQEEMQLLENERGDLQASLEKYKDTQRDLTTTIQQNTSRIKTLEKHREELRQKLAYNLEKINTVNEQIKLLESTQAQTQAQITELKNKEVQPGTLQTRLSQDTEQAAELQLKLEKLKETVSRLATENAQENLDLNLYTCIECGLDANAQDATQIHNKHWVHNEACALRLLLERSVSVDGQCKCKLCNADITLDDVRPLIPLKPDPTISAEVSLPFLSKLLSRIDVLIPWTSSNLILKLIDKRDADMQWTRSQFDGGLTVYQVAWYLWSIEGFQQKVLDVFHTDRALKITQHLTDTSQLPQISYLCTCDLKTITEYVPKTTDEDRRKNHEFVNMYYPHFQIMSDDAQGHNEIFLKMYTEMVTYFDDIRYPCQTVYDIIVMAHSCTKEDENRPSFPVPCMFKNVMDKTVLFDTNTGKHVHTDEWELTKYRQYTHIDSHFEIYNPPDNEDSPYKCKLNDWSDDEENVKLVNDLTTLNVFQDKRIRESLFQKALIKSETILLSTHARELLVVYALAFGNGVEYLIARLQKLECAKLPYLCINDKIIYLMDSFLGALMEFGTKERNAKYLEAWEYFTSKLQEFHFEHRPVPQKNDALQNAVLQKFDDVKNLIANKVLLFKDQGNFSSYQKFVKIVNHFQNQLKFEWDHDFTMQVTGKCIDLFIRFVGHNYSCAVQYMLPYQFSTHRWYPFRFHDYKIWDYDKENVPSNTIYDQDTLDMFKRFSKHMKIQFWALEQLQKKTDPSEKREHETLLFSIRPNAM